MEKIIDHSNKRYEINQKEYEKQEKALLEEIESYKDRIMNTEEANMKNIMELKELNMVTKSFKEETFKNARYDHHISTEEVEQLLSPPKIK